MGLEDCQLPPPFTRCFSLLSQASHFPPLSCDSRQSLGTSCRPLSQIPVLSPLDASKAGVGAVTLPFLDPQMPTVCL